MTKMEASVKPFLVEKDDTGCQILRSSVLKTFVGFEQSPELKLLCLQSETLNDFYRNFEWFLTNHNF